MTVSTGTACQAPAAEGGAKEARAALGSAVPAPLPLGRGERKLKDLHCQLGPNNRARNGQWASKGRGADSNCTPPAKPLSSFPSFTIITLCISLDFPRLTNSPSLDKPKPVGLAHQPFHIESKPFLSHFTSPFLTQNEDLLCHLRPRRRRYRCHHLRQGSGHCAVSC